ncbi:extracellular solute-binding protein [Streptomyces sp. NPDC012693]|jgi:ABC-type glycerol-3-phosphate transport system substrate-binding protein|uniref:ABC transporter substrate-binding protein n=1 Tax=unclassified Streptomyces TaxID=2593676 RepID=UPI0020309991|nr:extracellular solute-binding protein [Streptomyces sp. MSC1_001]
MSVRISRRTAAMCALLVAATGLTACGGLTPGGDAADTTGPVSTAMPTGKATLTIASSEDAGTTKALAEAFHARYPNITVDFQYTSVDDYDKSLNLKLSSNSAPDLALLNKLGTTVKANLVRDLDPYVDAYGWTDKYPSTQLDQWRANDDGTQLGIGNLWAAPAGFSVVGVYYNKELAKKLGIGVPESRAEFDAALAKAKAAGVLPLQLGNLQGHSSFIVQSIVDSIDGAAKTSGWINGNSGSSIRTEGGVNASNTLADWAKKGYLPAGVNGTDLNGSVAKFTKGEGLFLFDGNWDAKVINEAMREKAGFIAFPGSDGKTTAIGTSLAYAIPTKAKNPDLAAAFLDFMNTPEAAQIQFATGFLPVAHADTVKTEPGTVPHDIVQAWSRVNKDNGLVNFFANTNATMNDTLTSQSQRLIGGKISPEDFLDALQNDWTKGHQ